MQHKTATKETAKPYKELPFFILNSCFKLLLQKYPKYPMKEKKAGFRFENRLFSCFILN